MNSLEDKLRILSDEYINQQNMIKLLKDNLPNHLKKFAQKGERRAMIIQDTKIWTDESLRELAEWLNSEGISVEEIIGTPEGESFASKKTYPLYVCW